MYHSSLQKFTPTEQFMLNRTTIKLSVDQIEQWRFPPRCFHIRPWCMQWITWIEFPSKSKACNAAPPFTGEAEWAAFDRWLHRFLHQPPPPLLCIAVYVYNCIQRQIIVHIVCYNLINFSKARAASQRHPTYVSPKCKSNVHSPACAWYFKLHFILIANCKFDKLDGILSMTKAPFQNQIVLCHCIVQLC